MKTIQTAILGFGTVGTGIYHILTQNHGSIEHREQLDMKVKRIYVRDIQKPLRMQVENKEALLCNNIDDIIGDREIEIVFEAMGGIDPAREFIVRLLEAGKTVVTANKEVVAKHWPEFEAAARKSGAGFYIEATSGGGIPIIRTLLDGMQGNNIDRLMGIINGTTNYILTKMTEEDASYEDVLKEAQELGFAEADPTADVEGWDVVYKLSILASIAFHARVEYDQIYREGISKISKEDIAVAKELGYVIKLLAIGKKMGGSHGQMQLRVHPTMIPVTHPLASVRGSFNAVFLHGDAVDDLMLYGRGAGQLPTASAMVSDAVYAAKAEKHAYMTFDNSYGAPQTLTLQPDWDSAYCVRLYVADKPGVLADITSVFAKYGVSIHSIMQRGAADEKGEEASLVIITHTAKELAVQQSVREIQELSRIKEVQSLIRVEY